MKRYESRCVDCGLPCIGVGCPYFRVKVLYCDVCNEDDAEYEMEDYELCEDCAEKRLLEIFNDLSTEEKAKALDVDIKRIDTYEE